MNHHSQSQKFFCYLFAALVLTFLQGCVVVTPQKPFSEDKIDFIELNKTTKDDVIARLGRPSVVRKDGAIFLYETRAMVAFI